jgi:hypothetical protein
MKKTLENQWIDTKNCVHLLKNVSCLFIHEQFVPKGVQWLPKNSSSDNSSLKTFFVLENCLLGDAFFGENAFFDEEVFREEIFECPNRLLCMLKRTKSYVYLLFVLIATTLGLTSHIVLS